MTNKNELQQNSNLRDELIFALTNLYDVKLEDIKDLSIDELTKMLEEKKQIEIARKENPNKFWLIKGLPVPIFEKPKTSKKAGIVVVVMLFVVLLLAGVGFILLAFRANGMI